MFYRVPTHPSKSVMCNESFILDTHHKTILVESFVCVPMKVAHEMYLAFGSEMVLA